MTAITLPKNTLKAGYTDSETGWGAGMNRNLRVLDTLVNLSVLDKDLTTPPVGVSGAAYIVGAAATGAWSGKAGNVAIWCIGDDLPSGEWTFVPPRESLRAWVADESVFYQYVSGAWALDNSSGVAPSRHTEVIGDGLATSFTIPHGLGDRAVQVTAYRNSTPWDTVECAVSRPDINTVEVSGFAAVPLASEFVVLVRK